MARITPTFFVAVFSAILQAISAEMACMGTLQNLIPIKSDVIVKGVSCTLRNVMITGSVTVLEGGVLFTSGEVTIQGSLTGERNGDILLDGNLKVLGGISVSDSTATLTIGPDADVGTVNIRGVATLITRGTMSSINAIESGPISILGGTVTSGGVFREGGDGDLLICAATINGGITLVEMNGNFVAESGSDCGPSSLVGAVTEEKGKGNVNIVGNKLSSGDLLVNEQEENVIARKTALSDLSLHLVFGDILLQNITADSDGLITETEGDVTVSGSRLDGETELNGNWNVDLKNNNFGFKDLSIVETLALLQ